MKFKVLAIDYDGTTAIDGVFDRDVRTAVAEARRAGIVVVLVTGRILNELRKLMGDLRLFDAVVAENGAVIAFPQAGRSTVTATPPPREFVPELRRRGIDAIAGECVVEADSDRACDILPVIREMELPLAMLFNRGRVMVLPQAISKATGFRRALSALRLSEHNAIGIGDAENDHQLLEACEVGLAVSWGSAALKRVADGVIEGNGPPAVAAYIRSVTGSQRIPPQRAGRRRLLLGSDVEGRPLSLAVRGRNVLIAGDPQSGKSWVAGLLCEQLILMGYCVCVIDPEGDYATLESLPGVIVMGGEDPPPQIRELTRALRYPDVSVVIDLSRMKQRDKREYVASLLMTLAELRRDVGLPHRIVVDEAHYFLHSPEVRDLLDLELAGYTLISYQVSRLHSEVLASAEAIVVTRVNDPVEAGALREIVNGEEDPRRWEATLADLPINEAVLLPNADEARGELKRFHIAPRMTSHVRHQHKYLDAPVPDWRAFVFTRNGKPTGMRARTLKEMIAILASTSTEVLDSHLRKGDLSRWVGDVFRDNLLASQIEALEKQYRLGRVADVNDALIRLIQDRYE